MRILSQFFRVVISIVIACVIINGLLLVTKYQNKPIAWGWSTEVMHEEELAKQRYFLNSELIHVPNTDVTRNDGVRYADELGMRPTGDRISGNDVHNIVVIGDSFTYGYLLKHDETMPYYLEKYLRDTGNIVNVYNAGVEGYGGDQEFLYLRDYILTKITPEIVIWNISLNDVEDNNRACLFAPNREVFTQLPAWRNTSYIQGFLSQYTPKPIRDTPLANMLIYSISPGWERQTIGCTRHLFFPGELDELQARKFQFLIRELQSLGKRYHFKLIVTLGVSQTYLDLRIPNDNKSLETYNRLDALLGSTTAIYINQNILVADAIDNRIGEVRGTVFPIHTALPSVMGIPTGVIEQRVDINTAFIAEGKDSFGFWHPTAALNKIIAMVLSPDIASIILTK